MKAGRLKILVIGGGPAGLTAAIAAARAGADVAVAERMDRVGKKLLASGNGRCNLSNAIINESNYHGAGAKPAFSILERAGDGFVAGFFNSVGVLITLEDHERYYPSTFHSNTVLDALRAEAARLGVSEMCDHKAIRVKKAGDVFITGFHDKPEYRSDRVIVAAGGMASPFLGSDGSGYKLFEELCHHIVAPAPMLTQIHLAAGDIRGLKGVRIRAGLSLLESRPAEVRPAGVHRGDVRPAEVRPGRSSIATRSLYVEKPADRIVFKESGELLFTDNGLSGIPALNLSCRLAPQISAEPGANRVKNGAFMRCAGYAASIDLFPEFSHTELYEFIRAQVKNKPGIALRDILGGIVHSRITGHIIRRILLERQEGTRSPGKIPGAESVERLPFNESQTGRLTGALKDWRHTLTGTAGFENAQATYGGLSFNDFDAETLESKIVKGLYAAGEILDTAGECGGYNLQWAWVSGYTAGSRAAGSTRDIMKNSL